MAHGSGSAHAVVEASTATTTGSEQDRHDRERERREHARGDRTRRRRPRRWRVGHHARHGDRGPGGGQGDEEHADRARPARGDRPRRARAEQRDAQRAREHIAVERQHDDDQRAHERWHGEPAVDCELDTGEDRQHEQQHERGTPEAADHTHADDREQHDRPEEKARAVLHPRHGGTIGEAEDELGHERGRNEHEQREPPGDDPGEEAHSRAVQGQREGEEVGGRGAPERAADARLAEGEGQPDGHDEVGTHGCGSRGDRGEEQHRATGLGDRRRQREHAGSCQGRQCAVAGVVRHPQEGARLPVVTVEPAAHQPEQDGGEERRVVAEQDHRAEEHRHLPGRGELVRKDGDAVGEQRDGEHEHAEDQRQLHRVAGGDQHRGRQHRGGFETDCERTRRPERPPPSTCRSASPETRFGRLDAIQTPAAPRCAPPYPCLSFRSERAGTVPTVVDDPRVRLSHDPGETAHQRDRGRPTPLASPGPRGAQHRLDDAVDVGVGHARPLGRHSPVRKISSATRRRGSRSRRTPAAGASASTRAGPRCRATRGARGSTGRRRTGPSTRDHGEPVRGLAARARSGMNPMPGDVGERRAVRAR